MDNEADIDYMTEGSAVKKQLLAIFSVFDKKKINML